MSKPVWLSAYVVNVCARAARDRRVAVDQLLDDAAHHLDAERQRHDVEQHDLVWSPPASDVGLDRRAERDDLVGIEVARAAPCRTARATKSRTTGERVEPPTRITPSSSSCVELGVLEHAAARLAASVEQRLRRARRSSSRVMRRWRAVGADVDVDVVGVGERCLTRARLGDARAATSRGDALVDASSSSEASLGDRAVDVVAAERAVAAGRLHLEDAVVELEDRDVERAAAEVEDGERALAASSRPYASAAAVGSSSRRSTSSPASRPASCVAWRCASSKYAGTVMTAPSIGPPSSRSARAFSSLQDLGARPRPARPAPARELDLHGAVVARRARTAACARTLSSRRSAAAHEALHATRSSRADASIAWRLRRRARPTTLPSAP